VSIEKSSIETNVTFFDEGENMFFKRVTMFGAVGAQIYFLDDFENPTESQSKWEVITGQWEVADGVYHQLDTADPWQASMVASDQWNDAWEEYTIEFDVKVLTEGDAPVNVLFRVREPVPQVWADRNGPNTQMYRWIVNGWTNTESRPYMYNKGSAVMLAQTDCSLIVGNWHHIKLVVTKTGLAGYVDDVEMFDVEHAEWTDGRVGIQAYSGMMDFDNFIVYGKGPYATSPNPPDGALHSDTWVNLNWSPGAFAVSHDVYLGGNFNDVEEATRDSDVYRGNQVTTMYVAGFPGFAYPDGLVPGTTYYWRIDEVNDADPNSPWKGPVWSFSIPPQTAYNPNPADGAEFVGPEDVTLSWTPGFGAKLHTIFLGDDYDEISNATVGVPVGTASYNPDPLELEKVYYWRVDEFDGLATYKGDVWGFTTPGAAGAPQPANRAVDVQHTPILTWIPAENASSHQIYFGTDEDAVKNATTDSPEYIGSRALGSESYESGKLDWHTSYYWRVDAVYGANTVKGLVWSFTTADFLLIDDFESYTDDDAAGEAIWQHWIDGFGIADNGAQVGYLMPPYAEQTVVHGGAQSMPLLYVNEVGVTNSEAVLTLTAPRDWTAEGVGQLSLWIRGNVANAAEPLYVAVANGTGAPAVVAHDDANAAQKASWRQWIIPLQAFADQGVNLTNVDKIAIGLGSKSGMAVVGGSGTIFIDDIRLYRP
jgi:hypothetical protein